VGDGSSSQIRLVYSCELKPPVCYTALSHCWGRLHIKTLLESNMSELQQGVELRELPRTFQERVLSTRVLHFDKGGLFWECRSSCATEICQRGLPHANLYSGVD